VIDKENEVNLALAKAPTGKSLKREIKAPAEVSR
jgi:hypothetical protein